VRRRDFLQFGCSLTATGLLFGLSPFPGSAPPHLFAAESDHPARYAVSHADGTMVCTLCPNGCRTKPGETGKCRVRGNRGGRYLSLCYGRPCVLALDPVEKCPLFHFSVPAPALSIATAGCNLFCLYCQNWQFSQKSTAETRHFSLTPEEVINKARQFKAGAITFFYTEPTIYIEYLEDIATLAKKAGLPTVMVTAGYINPEPLAALFPLIDAFVVGLKAFSDTFYQEVVGGRVAPVLRTLRAIKASGRHLEVVTLLIPNRNDDEAQLKRGFAWVTKHLGPDVPYHLTRFDPQYRLASLPPTPVPVLERARSMAMECGLRFVYTGNLPGHEGNHTWCPQCKTLLIERLGFQRLASHLADGRCPKCQTPIPGSWKP
jgi:pyruvate formate lyase activating enzyme